MHPVITVYDIRVDCVSSVGKESSPSIVGLDLPKRLVRRFKAALANGFLVSSDCVAAHLPRPAL